MSLSIEVIGSQEYTDEDIHLLRKEQLENGILIIRSPDDQVNTIKATGEKFSNLFNDKGIDVTFIVIPYSMEIMQIKLKEDTKIYGIIELMTKFIDKILRGKPIT